MSDPSDDHLIPLFAPYNAFNDIMKILIKMLIAQFLVLDSLTRWIWQTGRSIAQLSGVEVAVVVMAMGQWSQQSNQQRCSSPHFVKFDKGLLYLFLTKALPLPGLHQHPQLHSLHLLQVHQDPLPSSVSPSALILFWQLHSVHLSSMQTDNVTRHLAAYL